MNDTDRERNNESATSETTKVHQADDQVVIQLKEEELVPRKDWTEAGALLLSKDVETRTDTMSVPIAYEEAHVERVPVNRVLGTGERPEPKQEGDTWVIPVIEERLVAMKQLVLAEEVRITKLRKEKQEEVSGEVKREVLRVDTEGHLRSSK